MLRVFVASPSDVMDERNACNEVIDELNTTWSKHLGIRLEAVRWETHGYPGMASDAQEVINQEVADDYDIFLGILWTRFGTPTPRAASGTAEEFQRAYDRHKAASGSVKIMFYFKTAPVSPAQLDPEQLAAINTFQQQLGDKGALYWTFSDRDEFGHMLRTHLSKQVQDFLASASSAGAKQHLSNAREALGATGEDTRPAEPTPNEDIGFLDAVQDSWVGFQTVTEIVTGLGYETAAYSEQVVERTKEMEDALLAAPDPQPTWRAAKRYADDMDRFAERIMKDIPAYAEATDKAFSSTSQAVALLIDFELENTDELEAMLMTLRTLNESTSGARQNLSGLRDITAKQPPLTTLISRSKRKLVTAFDNLLKEMDRSINLGAAVASGIEEVIHDVREMTHRNSRDIRDGTDRGSDGGDQ